MHIYILYCLLKERDKMNFVPQSGNTALIVFLRNHGRNIVAVSESIQRRPRHIQCRYVWRSIHSEHILPHLLPDLLPVTGIHPGGATAL